MVMNSNLQLALRIAGTKERRAGFSPLVSVGVLPGGEGDNMYRSTMVAERPAYVIKHAEGYILYQLIDRGVKPFNSEANGLLNIALAISSNAQLAEGKSPFTLLDEVYKKFVETYMEPTNDGRLSFLGTDNDNDIFRVIVGKYSLEERKSPYIVMNPTGLTGIVCVTPADMEDFFKDTQYKEFAPFKEIEVGVNCHALVSPGFEKLQIPLPPPVFDVWVNGKSTGVSLQFHDDSYTATVESTKFYSYDSADFTLGELLTAPLNRISKNGAVISLDFQKNRINCDLKKADVRYDFVYDWTDNIGQAKEQICSLIRAGKIKLYFGEENISSTVFEGGHIRGVDIKDRKVSIIPKVVGNFSLSSKCDIDFVEHRIVTKITINRRIISNLGITDGSKRIGQANRPSNVNQHNGNVVDNGNTQTEQPKSQDKKKFDVMSFVFGLVVGLLIGLGTWGGVSMLDNGQMDKVTAPDSIAERTDTVYITREGKSAVTDSGTIAGDEAESIEVEDEDKILKEREAIAEKQKQAAEDKQALAELISAINSKDDPKKIRKLKGWTKLSKSDRIIVEAVMRPEQFKKGLNAQGQLLLDDIKNRSFSFRTLDDVKVVQQEIMSIINNQYYKE
jgi:hypothetical protein